MSLTGNIMGMQAYMSHVRGDNDKALELYEKMMKSNPTKIKYIHAYGVLLMQVGRFDESLEVYSRALRMRPDPQSRYNIRLDRAIVYIKTGDFERAKAALEDLHRKNHNLRVYQTLGYLYILMGDDEMAKKYNNEAIDYMPEDPIILDNMCQYCINHEDFEDADYFAKKAYSQREDQVNILYHLAFIREHYGDLDEALIFINKAKECKITAMNEINMQILEETRDRIESKLNKK